MPSLKWLLFGPPVGYYNYLTIDAILIKETPKAILITFDGQKTWLPKSWILSIKRSSYNVIARSRRRRRRSNLIRIRISEYHWAKKFV